MDAVAAAVSSFLKQYALERKPLLLAVSGGLDSICLLNALVQSGIRPGLAHVNYGLRGADSQADEHLVRQLARLHNLRLHVLRASAKPPGANTQRWARELRYRYFSFLRKKHGYAGVLLAHHRDDQEETQLLALTRGGGVRQLAGLLPRRKNIFRPLLSVGKAELLAYAEHHNLTWREDSSNAKLVYRRNQMRHQVLPLLHDLDPQVVAKMRHSTFQLQAEAALLEEYLKSLRKKYLSEPPPGAYRLINMDWLKEHPQADYLLYGWLRKLAFPIETCRDMLAPHESGARWENSRGSAYLYRGKLVVFRGALPDFSWEARPATSVLELPFLGLWEIVDPAAKEGSALGPFVNESFPRHLLTADAQWRLWQAGDQLQLTGFRKTVKRLLQEAHIWPHLRPYWPVLVMNNQIAWVPGCRLAEPYRSLPPVADGRYWFLSYPV